MHGMLFFCVYSNTMLKMLCHVRISNHNRLHFEVEWKNHAEHTWEHVDNLVDCSDSLDEFWENIDNLWYD